MTAFPVSAGALSPQPDRPGSRPFVVLDDTLCGPGDGYPGALSALIQQALRCTTPDRVLLTAQESRSPWWAPQVAERGIRVLTLPVDRGRGLHLAVAALELCRRDPGARVVFATGPWDEAATRRLPDRGAFGAALHAVRDAEGRPIAVRGSAGAFAAHLASASPDGFELLLFAVACSTDQERPELLDSAFLYLEYVDDARWIPGIPSSAGEVRAANDAPWEPRDPTPARFATGS